MTPQTIYVDEKSNIPLFGVDFIGIIDRGTNIIELKPITLCNLKCRYCFVSSGAYETNFVVDSDYFIKKVEEVVNIKGKQDIEIHIAPYGETLLYKDLFKLIKSLWTIKGIKTISMQSNGLLLNEDIIKKLEEVGLTRINLSLNTLNNELAGKLCNIANYNMDLLLKNIGLLLETKVDVLLAPVWFPGENDNDIEDIIKYVVELRNSNKNIQLGIQKYLVYRTGRKLKKIRPKTWGYFYSQLSKLEKKYNIKLKLGPNDFGIHKRKQFYSLGLKQNDLISVKIVSKGRWEKEVIGKINDTMGIKILLQKPIKYSDKMIGKKIQAKVIKANYRDNIVTSIFPIS